MDSKMRSTLTSSQHPHHHQQQQQQQQLLQQHRLSNGLTISDQAQTDLSLNDVIEVIRHSDPDTFAQFQSQLSAMTSSSSVTTSKAAMAELNRQKKQAFVKITEQPASKGLRFRYECEGRSAGSIPGVSSTNELKTYPTIEVVGYKGRAVVVVSCVTADAPYRPHPHSLVGKEGCKKGVCTLEIPPDSMAMSFQSLGIQCVKKKEIEEALTLRQQIRVDPFQTGFAHRDNTQCLDLNCVRLCFQVFLEGNEKGAFTFALKPVVSDPIFDKKAKNDLTICRMTECSASAAGGKEMLLFCDKVIKDDIQVRFYEEKLGKVVWEAFGDFQPSDVHKQYGIAFRTPRYKDMEIEQPVKAFVQLRRPSDGALSDPRPFELLPLDSGRGFWTAKRLKTNYSVFNSILTVDNQAEEQRRRKSRQVAAAAQGSSSALVNAQQTSPTVSSTTADLAINPLPLPPKAAAVAAPRPLSQASLGSDVSNADTVVTRQSVNEILSLADTNSVYSMELNEAISGTGDMSFQSMMKMTNPTSQGVKTELESSMIDYTTKNPIMGSISSVNTVKENNTMTRSMPLMDTTMDVDVATLYDDVMQCVYDDVDTKYDPVQFGEVTDPPTTSPRTSSRPDTHPDRPLPGTPSKLPTIIASMIGKKSDTLSRKTTSDSDMVEKRNKKKPETQTKAGGGSLFQRVFHRTRSQSELMTQGKGHQDQVNANLDSDNNTAVSSAPPVPPHKSLLGNQETSVDSLNGNEATEEDLTALQQFLDSDNMDNLDNMVSEFAKEYLPSSSSNNNPVSGNS